MFWFDNQEAIGGPGKVVELDETCFGKRKNHKGRKLGQVWVFGGYERVSKKRFLVPLLKFKEDDDKDDQESAATDDPEVEKRDAPTLIPLIQKFVVPGSTITTDCWGAYLSNYADRELKDYTHKFVNHRRGFVNPEDKTANTQSVERMWLDVKTWSQRPGMRGKYFKQYFGRYLFLHDHEDNAVHKFLEEAGKLYRHPGARSEQQCAKPESDCEED